MVTCNSKHQGPPAPAGRCVQVIVDGELRLGRLDLMCGSLFGNLGEHAAASHGFREANPTIQQWPWAEVYYSGKAEDSQAFEGMVQVQREEREEHQLSKNKTVAQGKTVVGKAESQGSAACRALTPKVRTAVEVVVRQLKALWCNEAWASAVKVSHFRGHISKLCILRQDANARGDRQESVYLASILDGLEQARKFVQHCRASSRSGKARSQVKAEEHDSLQAWLRCMLDLGIEARPSVFLHAAKVSFLHAMSQENAAQEPRFDALDKGFWGCWRLVKTREGHFCLAYSCE